MKKKYELAVSLQLGKVSFDFYHDFFTDDPERFVSAVRSLVSRRFLVGVLLISFSELDDEHFGYPCSLKPSQCADEVSYGLINIILGRVFCYGK